MAIESSSLSAVDRMALFDAATARQELRQRGRTPRKAQHRGKHPTDEPAATNDRGWTREDVYTRGSAR